MIKGIVCIGANGVMGKDGSMPWGDKPLDGPHFKKLTEGHTVVMGRKTYESMGRKGLKNRITLLLTNDPKYNVPPSTVNVLISSKEQVITSATNFPQKDMWVIGGAEIFKEFMPYIEEMYVTTVGDDFEGDTFFPDMHENIKWTGEVLGMEEKNGFHLIYRKFTKK